MAKELDDKQIIVVFRVYPHCNHQEFVPACIWCADGQKVYKELLDLQRKYSSHRTKVVVVEAQNPYGK